MASWPKRLLAAGLGISTALFTGEIGLRISAHLRNLGLLEVALENEDFAVPAEGRVSLGHIIQLTPNDRIIYELKRNLSGVRFKDAELRTNAHGFRGPEIPPATDETITIVALGDSILFGHGVEEHEGYARQLEGDLNSAYPAKDWRVINTGVPGYSTVMEVETLVTKALQFEPDLVLWNLVPNDLELPPYLRTEEQPLDVTRSFLAERIEKELREGPSYERHPLFERAPEYTPEEQQARANGAELFEVPDDLPERYRSIVGWKAWDAAADELVALSVEHDFKLIAFATVTDDTVDLMIAGAKQRGLPTFTMKDELFAHMDAIDNHHYKYTDLVVSPQNLHPSALQHRMTCDKLLARLEAVGWIEELAGSAIGH